MTIASRKTPPRSGLLWRCAVILTFPALLMHPVSASAEGEWETTPASEAALEHGLQWLAANQGPEGNWQSNDLGLVSLGALAFLSAGHTPGHGKYGAVVDKALDYVLRNARPNGLLNIAGPQRDMYNHGLAAFVLGQAYGMTNDKRISAVLDRALALIANTQCDDGGWDYRAHRQPRGHDLSLVVMQAKALRGAMDSGLEVSPVVTRLAIRSVRAHYRAQSGGNNFDDPAVRAQPGQFTYDGHGGSLAMAACGVVCLQEFGEYDDWRIARNMDLITRSVSQLTPAKIRGRIPLGAYSLYYVGQALYQVGGQPWRDCYPPLREALVASQQLATGDPRQDGAWEDAVHLSGQPGRLYGTAVGCFVLAIPNRYLPILQEGRIDSLKAETRKK
ncbi:MAG TPA: squalene--hopene cyclase [Planctomycetaceae bacterium]|nr:squalene--hopene cyclase [Planctomycetaceae bacterium]